MLTNKTFMTENVRLFDERFSTKFFFKDFLWLEIFQRHENIFIHNTLSQKFNPPEVEVGRSL